MKIKHNYVSPQYHQMYFTFTAGEMKEIFSEVISEHGLSDKAAKKQKKYIKELVMEKIEDDIIEDELSRIDVVPVCSRKFRYLTELSDSAPLLVICQFCILPADLQIRFPTKIAKEIFAIPHEEEILNDFINQILLSHNEFTYQNVTQADKTSIVKYDLTYQKDDFVISEIPDQTIDLGDFTQEQRSLFQDCKIGDTIQLDEDDDIKTIAKVKEIQNKVMNPLSDEVVSNLGFLGLKTAAEFTDKIRKIFEFSTAVVILLNYLAGFVLQTGDITFDEYVIGHFMDGDYAPKKKKDAETYINEIKKEVIKEYIVWVINLNYNDDETPYLDKVIEEYEFDKFLFNNPSRIDSYQDYVNHHAFEARVLEYCLEQKIIDITL